MAPMVQLSFVWPTRIRCTRCGLAGTAAHFYPGDMHTSGLTGRCKRCVAARGRAARQAWRARRPDLVTAYKARYRKKHAAALAAKQRLYAATHPSPPRPYTAREATRDQAWRDANRPRVNAYAASARARRDGAVIVEVVLLTVVYERDNGICQICLAPCEWLDATRDHIVAPRDGGEHSYANIQLAHRSCNVRRGIQQRDARRHRHHS